ncbi:LOW QUALITY PROTEIN: programmed cell death protein 2-like [Anoplopoma fimbria]|uniref:LOW QUALITY PROTEIN: programmed cell death protein 2-like n=1 Tax=Anoplopoma fimbria TaxID=229290 RepID=UPI0023EAA999|nr:LOW QUALITY PROTEIN: programmed cell death protein 2-like [Anoplopoma fimbria]
MAAPTALLGLCDAELDSKRHRSSCLTNKLGGAPDWPPHASRTPPRCGRCGAPLAHVVQVYCPLQGSPYHRNLHLFACTSAACSGRSDTWTALRSQSLEERTPSRPDPPQEAPLAATDWCDTADDWGVEEGGGGGGGGGGVKEEEEGGASGEFDVSSQLQDLRLLDSQDDVPVLREFFISVVEESDLCGEEDDLHHARKLLKEYERREGVAVGELEDGDGGGDGGKEKYEKTRARHGDAVFSRFMKKISLCPQQILRYSHGGKPLFISEPPADLDRLVTACGSCGGTRTFELQLMPALVSLLRGKDGGGVEAELEFGTVLVYTCRDSCWTAGSGSGSGSPVEEFCFVQTDPDQQLFK